ncbi:MAG TPA: dimeric alpha+beta barrel [Xanthobacteraceae bacterium]|nr:dimeric alpha+beta barrel [Xanthobacteraceae bacterium]
MKILALIGIARGASIETIRAEMANELKGSWQLFAAGVLREAYATAEPSRVIFVLEADDTAQAHEHLRKLPLVAAGLLSVELVQLRPFVNWSKLFSSDCSGRDDRADERSH